MSNTPHGMQLIICDCSSDMQCPNGKDTIVRCKIWKRIEGQQSFKDHVAAYEEQEDALRE